jgi:hypothetical protein
MDALALSWCYPGVIFRVILALLTGYSGVFGVIFQKLHNSWR